MFSVDDMLQIYLFFRIIKKKKKCKPTKFIRIRISSIGISHYYWQNCAVILNEYTN